MKNMFILVSVLAGLSLVILSCSGEKKGQSAAESIASTVEIADTTYYPKTLPGEPDIDSVLAVDEQPRPIKQVQADYPKDALDNGIEGTVWVKFLLDKQGNVRRCVVIKRKGTESFERAALGALAGWKFTPAMINHQPVELWAAMPFRFKLKKD